ncbi:hypothetical protein [Rhodococcus sp. 24CO]|uniref:hypothetical protein n=1 Tax=Rhodococcus sp. 24CO TaxID=3117460 RepID=UPI003D3485F9
MRVLRAILTSVVVVCVVAVGVYLVIHRSPQGDPSRPLADTSAIIDGQRTTCAELFGETCSFDLQSEYNQWGESIESFVNSGVLGPYARSIGFVPAAKLSLQACGVSNTAGRTVLDFNVLVRADHPEASTTDLFPFWNASRQSLCPAAP